MNDTHHLSQAGVITGPFTTAQIRSLWKSGGITADSMHRPAGSETWSPVADLIKNTSVFTATMGRRGHLTPWGWAGSIAGGIGTFTTPGLIGFIPLTVWIVSYFKLRRGDDFRPFTGGFWLKSAFAAALILVTILGWRDYQATAARNAQRRAMSQYQLQAAVERQAELMAREQAAAQQALENQSRAAQDQAAQAQAQQIKALQSGQ